MNTTEQEVIKGIISNFSNVTITDWKNNEGDIESWAIWARSMKTSIIQNKKILDSLITASKTIEDILP